MAVYTENAGVLKLAEQHLYGSSRVGVWNRSIDMDATLSVTSNSLLRGMKSYELANHLGNVLVTLADTRQPIVVNNAVTGYQPVVLSATDNYSFGMLMPERNFSAGAYRYGFNGKERDKDIGGDDYDYGMRIYDARVGRFLSVDPLEQNFPWYTPYQYAGNKPIWAKDLDGAEEVLLGSNGVEFGIDKLGTEEGVSPWQGAANTISKGGGPSDISVSPGGAMTTSVGSGGAASSAIKWQGLPWLLPPNPLIEPQLKKSDAPLGPLQAPQKDPNTQSNPKRQFDPHQEPIKENDDDGDKPFYVTYTKVVVNKDGTATKYSGRTSGTYRGAAPTSV